VYDRNSATWNGIATFDVRLHHYGAHGYLSGGFTYFADRVQVEYGMTEVHVLLFFENRKMVS